MTNNLNNIFYVDQSILDWIETEFELVDDKGWYQLLRKDDTYWRLDKCDKYQQRCLVRLQSINNWIEFNDEELRIQLLKESRGISDAKCIWNNCNKKSLNKLVYCEIHAYKEMDVRK